MTATNAPIEGWLSSPWIFDPIQSASSGLPVQMFRARKAITAASSTV